MKTTLTAKLKLQTTRDQFAALRRTQLSYREALNAMSRFAYAQGKTSNVMTLHKGMYQQVRARFHLPSQMACSVERQAAASYKTLWTKTRQNARQRKSGRTKKRYKGLDQPPSYVSPTLTYTSERDYTLKKGQQVSLLTLTGRVKVSYTGYSGHLARIAQGAEIGRDLPLPPV